MHQGAARSSAHARASAPRARGRLAQAWRGGGGGVRPRCLLRLGRGSGARGSTQQPHLLLLIHALGRLGLRHLEQLLLLLGLPLLVRLKHTRGWGGVRWGGERRGGHQGSVHTSRGVALRLAGVAGPWLWRQGAAHGPHFAAGTGMVGVQRAGQQLARPHTQHMHAAHLLVLPRNDAQAKAHVEAGLHHARDLPAHARVCTLELPQAVPASARGWPATAPVPPFPQLTHARMYARTRRACDMRPHAPARVRALLGGLGHLAQQLLHVLVDGRRQVGHARGRHGLQGAACMK